MRDDKGRLEDILEAIENIKRYSLRGKKAFEVNDLLQTHAIHNIQIIGEAVRGLSAGRKKKHPGVPWREIVQMRNVLVHEYFAVNVDRVWSVIRRDLPRLKRQIQTIVATLNKSS